MAGTLIAEEEKLQYVPQNEDVQGTLDEGKAGDQKYSHEMETMKMLTTVSGENISKHDSRSELTLKEANVSLKEVGVVPSNGNAAVAAGECGTPSDDTIGKENQSSFNEGDKVLQKPEIKREPPFHETDENTQNCSILDDKISLTSENDSILSEVDSTSSITLNKYLPAEVEVDPLSQYCPEIPSCFKDITEISKELFTTAKELCDRQEATENKAHCYPDQLETETKFSSCEEKLPTADDELVNSLERTFLEIESLNAEESFIEDVKEATSKPNSDDHPIRNEPIEIELCEGVQSKGTMTDLVEDNEKDDKSKLRSLAPSEHLARISKEIENAENMANIVIDKLKGSLQGVTGSIINMTEDLGHAINDLIQEITTNVSPFDDNLPQQTYALFDHLWHSLSQEVEQLKMLAEYVSSSVDSKFEN